ncbi:SLC13 family permease [Leptolyngbya sp. FACHB-261]|uniref:SLC13 family permease n=1 Tax=Leptolyngbya sp. FACHB-261 TaxID=2692806 RepID=UPI0016884758|nr:SLC13 family permease [Leptolyngbya sp. FACHB-261]MBD2103671.1 hypothetical protein [Leptolyngbya sp. FACHB-261]
MDWTAQAFVRCLILALTYAAIAFEERVIRFVDRPTAALAGAVAMVLLGGFPLDKPLSSLDAQTLLFLLGMIIFVAVLGQAGLFTRMISWFLSLPGLKPWGSLTICGSR